MSAFLKTKSVNTGQVGDVSDYALSQGKNETVEFLEGDIEALQLEDDIALQDGLKTSAIHAIYTSDIDLTPDQLQHMRQAMRAEYGLPVDAPSMLVMHKKAGRDGVMRKHCHEVVSIKDTGGRVANTFRSKKRDELVSRMCELDFGHELVPGRHNDFVYKAAVERGLDTKYQEAFQQIAHLKERARYSSVEDKISTRQQFDIHHWTSGLENVARMPEADQPKAFAALVNEFEGGEFKQGDRGRSRLLVSFGDDGENLKNANKILKIKANKVADFVASAQEHFDELRRRDDAGGLSGADAARGSGDARTRDAGDATGVRYDARARPEPGAVHGPERDGTGSDLVRLDVHDEGNESRHDTDNRTYDAQRLERGSSAAIDRADGGNRNETGGQARPGSGDEQVQVRQLGIELEKPAQKDGRDSAASSSRHDDVESEVAARSEELSGPPSEDRSETRIVEPRDEFDFAEAAIADEDVYRSIQRQHHRKDYDSVSDRLRDHNAAKEVAAQPEEPKVTIQHRLARSWIAQKVQPLLDKLRSRNVARRGRSAFDVRRRENLAEGLKEKLTALKLRNVSNHQTKEKTNDATIIRSQDATSVGRRAAEAERSITRTARSGSSRDRGTTNAGAVGGSLEGTRNGSRAVVDAGLPTKSDHSVLRAARDRIAGRAMGKAAREIEPMRRSFSENDGMYNSTGDLGVMPDIEDPMYAQKALAVWARSMGHIETLN